MKQAKKHSVGVLIVGLLAVTGCNNAAGERPESAASALAGAPAAAAPIERAALALAYEPSEAPTDQAIARAQDALRTSPDSLEAHLSLATLLMRRGRETSGAVYRVYADDVLVSARSVSPSSPRVRVLGTMLLLDEHKFEAAARAAEELAGMLPSDPTPRMLLGDASLEMGQYERAADAYQEAIDLRPDLRSYNRAAYMRWLYGDFDGALEIMELALDAGSLRDPESMAWCFTDLGGMYLRRGDEPRAVAAAERALRLVEGYAPAQALQSRALARQGKTDDAIKLLESAVSVRASAEDYLRLSELYATADRPTQAQEARDEADKLGAHDPRPLAEYLARRGEAPDTALALAEQEFDARQNIWAYDTLALALARSGRISEARGAMETAMALGTEDAEFHLHLALIEWKDGSPDMARESLERALSIDPKADPILVEELRSGLGEA